MSRDLLHSLRAPVKAQLMARMRVMFWMSHHPLDHLHLKAKSKKPNRLPRPETKTLKALASPRL